MLAELDLAHRMLAKLDLPQGRDNNAFIAALITEPPGALAILNRAGSQLSVYPLSPPKRGKRFSRYTKTGRILHTLHTDGVLRMVMINMPEAYNDTFGHGADVNDPDIAHLLKCLEQLGVTFFKTVTPLWRPYLGQQGENGTLANHVISSLPEALRDRPHAKAQCADVMLLALFANADVDYSQAAPLSHDNPVGSDSSTLD